MTCASPYRRIISGECGGLPAHLARGVLRVASVPYGVGASGHSSSGDLG